MRHRTGGFKIALNFCWSQARVASVALAALVALGGVAAMLLPSGTALGGGERVVLQAVSHGDDVVLEGDTIELGVRMENETGRERRVRMRFRVRGERFEDRTHRRKRSKWVRRVVKLPPGEVRTEVLRVGLPEGMVGAVVVQGGIHRRFRREQFGSIFVDEFDSTPSCSGGRLRAQPLLWGPGYDFQSGRIASTEAATYVIEDEESWAELASATGVEVPDSWSLARYNSETSDVLAAFARPHEIDFSSEIALAVFAGHKTPSDVGAFARVNSVRLRRDGTLRVSYSIVGPSRNSLGIGLQFSPFAIVAIPKCSFDQVEFKLSRSRR